MRVLAGHTVVLAGMLVGFIPASPARAQNDGQPACTGHPPPDATLPNGYPFDTHRALALFRFHQQNDALGELDAARAIVRGPWRWRRPPDRREELASELDALRDCLAASQPPALATLTVRVLGYTAGAADRLVPQAGARVYVEGIDVGRTGRDGTLTIRGPSGPIGVQAEVPINQWAWVDVSLAPGQSESIDIELSDGKEVNERTTLLLAEAVDDIVPVTSKSLTLRFMRDGHVARVERLDTIDVVDQDGNLKGEIGDHFRVAAGEIVATYPDRVFDSLAPRFDHTIRLRVHAMASSHEMHYGTIAFRVGQSPLSGTLVPPPSNPALSVSNVDLGISLIGAGIGLQRVSDANGRFEVEAFPHGSVALDCVVVSDGKYYYGQATLRHSGPREVMLILRHVDDVKNGVPPLRAP